MSPSRLALGPAAVWTLAAALLAAVVGLLADVAYWQRLGLVLLYWRPVSILGGAVAVALHLPAVVVAARIQERPLAAGAAAGVALLGALVVGRPHPCHMADGLWEPALWAAVVGVGSALAVDAAAGRPERARGAGRLAAVLLLAVLALGLYGRSVHPRVSAAWGGGRPYDLQLLGAPRQPSTVLRAWGLRLDADTLLILTADCQAVVFRGAPLVVLEGADLCPPRADV